MGFNAKNVIVGNISNKVEESEKIPLPLSLDLDKSEIEILLMIIRDSHFKGEHIQKIYELVLKLQLHYSQLP